MAKFFISSDLIKEDKVFIDGENANHLINSLRCKIGEEIQISSGDGYDFLIFSNLRISATKHLHCIFFPRLSHR